jgi:hypothetical protein
VVFSFLRGLGRGFSLGASTFVLSRIHFLFAPAYYRANKDAASNQKQQDAN